MPLYEKTLASFILSGNPILSLSDKNEFFALAHCSYSQLLPAVAHTTYRNNIFLSILFIVLPLTRISHHLVGISLTIFQACSGS